MISQLSGPYSIVRPSKFKSCLNIKYLPIISLMNNYQGHRNKGNDPQLKKLLIFLQILFFRTIRIIQRPVWRYTDK